MRLQLSGMVAVAVLGATAMAQADGAISARGVYYKERATRVVQPMFDAIFDAGARGLVNAHFLVDAITSASTAAGALDAEPFTEDRYEAGIGYTHEVDDLRVGASAKYSTESDYRAVFLGARGELDLAEKNTVVGLGVGASFDRMTGGAESGLGALMLACEPGELPTAACNLSVYTVFASVTQILSRNLVLGVSVDYSLHRGFQSNPYRQAVVGFQTDPEQHPTSRDRQAYAVSLRYFVSQTDTTVIGAYRFYRDNWLDTDAVGAGAHTPELRIVQQFGDVMDVSIRYRYHSQYRAYFYQERYDMPQTFVSDDVKLSDFSTNLFEGKLGVYGEMFGLEDSRWAGARLEAILQYVTQQNRFGDAIVGQLAFTVPFEY